MLTIPHGFAPLISPDGSQVACGLNDVQLVHLPSGAVEHLDVGGEANRCGWHDGKVVVSKYHAAGRELLNGPMMPPLNQNAGYMPIRAVLNGHVVSSANLTHYIDGQPVSYDAKESAIEDFDGRFYIYKPHDTWNLLVLDTDEELITIIRAPVTNAVVWTHPDAFPRVFANLANRGTIFHKDEDGMIWHQFQPGEFRGALSDGPDGPWAWTCGQFPDGTPFVCGRPFSDLTGPGLILRGLWWAGLQVQWKPHEQRWVIAGYYDGPGGTLYIEPAVDPAQPREVLNLTPAPQEPPAPPTIPNPGTPVPNPGTPPSAPPTPSPVPVYTKQEVQELVNRASSRLPYLLKRLNGPSEMRKAVQRELEVNP